MTASASPSATELATAATASPTTTPSFDPLKAPAASSKPPAADGGPLKDTALLVVVALGSALAVILGINAVGYLRRRLNAKHLVSRRGERERRDSISAPRVVQHDRGEWAT